MAKSATNYSALDPNMTMQGTTTTTAASTSTLTTSSSSATSWSSTTSMPYSGYYDTDTAISIDNWGDLIGDSWLKKFELSDANLDKLVERIFDNENDLVPIVKNYLTKYLEKIMDSPEEVIDDVIRDIINKKNMEIQDLNEKVGRLSKTIDNLNAKIDELSKLVERIMPPRVQPYDPYYDPYKSNISWTCSAGDSVADLTKIANKYIGSVSVDFASDCSAKNTTAEKRSKP